jgi:DNA-binding response OmpR family regulator
MGPLTASNTEKAQRRLLIVDDEQKICHLLVQHFSLKGYEVRGVLRGEEALAIAGVYRPDVVLLDLLMPGIDGVETLKGLKRLIPPPKVVMVSAADHEEVVKGTLRLGADFYVCKPIHFQELDELVRSFFQATDASP